MWRGLAVFVLVLAGVLVATQPASACSCAYADPREMLEGGDAAFVGTLIEREEPPGGFFSTADEVTYTFQIEQVVKGDLGETVEVESAIDGAACGFEIALGERIGVILYRDGDVWASGLCSQLDPDALVRASQPIPPPDGEGPVALLMPNPTGDAAVVALDAQGRVLAYGESETHSEIQQMAVCPGSERVIELIHEGQFPRLAIRNLRNMEVERILRPDGLNPGITAMACTSPDGATVLLRELTYILDGTEIRIIRVEEEQATVVYEATSNALDYGNVAFALERGLVYIVDPENQFAVLAINLDSGEPRPVATLVEPKREFGGISWLAVNPSGTRLAVNVTIQTSAAIFDSLFLIDLEPSPASVIEVTDEGHSMSSAAWITDDWLMLNGYRDSSQEILIYDAAGRHVRTISDFWLTHIVTREDIVYGIGYRGSGAMFPSLFSIPLPDGEPVALRPIDSPYVVDLVAVPDDVEIDPAAIPTAEPTVTPTTESATPTIESAADPATATATTELMATPVPNEQPGSGQGNPTDPGGAAASTDSNSGLGAGEMVIAGLALAAVAVGSWLVLRRRRPAPAA